jgi:cellulose biosynthesis protein BcsQ
MFSEIGLRTIAADLDPQANLSSIFLPEERIEDVWSKQPRATIYGALSPLFRGVGDISSPSIEEVNSRLALLVGDLALSEVEDELSTQWPRCLSGDERAFRVTAGFARLIEQAGQRFSADAAIIDVGPNLGAINRAALIACDFVVIPLGPDLFSLQGLRNMGPRLRSWRQEWLDRIARQPAMDVALPDGTMQPVGYVMMRHSIRLDRPVKAYARWIEQMPGEYSRSVLDRAKIGYPRIEDDPNCIAQLKDYRSLMPMAQEHNKPMFLLRPADGAIGGHQTAVQACYSDFEKLAKRVAERCGIAIESPRSAGLAGKH